MMHSTDTHYASIKCFGDVMIIFGVGTTISFILLINLSHNLFQSCWSALSIHA